MKHKKKYTMKCTGNPVVYLLATVICMVSLLGSCTNELGESPVVPDGIPVKLIAEIEASAPTKVAVSPNDYDRSSFIAGDKIRLIKTYNGNSQQADYTLSADASTWEQPTPNLITLQAGAKYKAVYPSSGDPGANYIMQDQTMAVNFRKSNKLMSGEITSRDGVLNFTGANAFTHQYTKITLNFKAKTGSLSGNFANTLISAPGLYSGGAGDESICLFRPDPNAYSWSGIVYPKNTDTAISLSLDYGGVTYKVSLDCAMATGKHYNYTLTIENGILVPSGSSIAEWKDEVTSGELT